MSLTVDANILIYTSNESEPVHGHVRTPGEDEGFWNIYLATRNDVDPWQRGCPMATLRR